MRYELTADERTANKPMLPNKPRGVPRMNDPFQQVNLQVGPLARGWRCLASPGKKSFQVGELGLAELAEVGLLIRVDDGADNLRWSFIESLKSLKCLLVRKPSLQIVGTSFGFHHFQDSEHILCRSALSFDGAQ
jgi:hypothetical protein